jgi:hypothetical protein
LYYCYTDGVVATRFFRLARISYFNLHAGTKGPLFVCSVAVVVGQRLVLGLQDEKGAEQVEQVAGGEDEERVA